MCVCVLCGREYFPDPRALYQEAEPGVEVSLVVSWVVNISANGSLAVNYTFTTSGTQAFYGAFFQWGALCLELGRPRCLLCLAPLSPVGWLVGPKV